MMFLAVVLLGWRLNQLADAILNQLKRMEQLARWCHDHPNMLIEVPDDEWCTAAFIRFLLMR
jgi:hypothetical protein